MDEGYLVIHTFLGERLTPVSGAKISIFCSCGIEILDVLTDENGLTKVLSLPASNDHNDLKVYTVKVSHTDNFAPITIRGVTIFPGLTSTLPVQMRPNEEGISEEEVLIPGKRGADIRM
jgi:hypothetical protein